MGSEQTISLANSICVEEMVLHCKLNFCRGRLGSVDSSGCPSLSAGLLQADFGGNCVCGVAFLAVDACEFCLSLFSPVLLGPQLLLNHVLNVSAGHIYLNLNN